MDLNEDDLQQLRESAEPNSTKQKVKWAMSLFSNWFSKWRVDYLSGGNKVLKEITEMTANDLDFCLQYFIPSVRKANGSKYPPRTLKEMVALVQHHFQYNLGRTWSIFLDPEFSGSRIILDATMKQLAREGLVRPTKKAEMIDLEHEQMLWTKGLLGTDSPQKLLDTLIFYLGLHLSLRACGEHRALCFGAESQLQLKKSRDGVEYLLYRENVSKNKNFGLKQCRMEPKEVNILPNTHNSSRCVIRLYKAYLSHRPETNGESGDSAFYLTPLVCPKGNIWFKRVPYGVHSIERTVKRLMESAGIEGYFTNTSLRRTARTRLIDGGIPDKVARKVTGHLSSAEDTYIAIANQRSSISNALYGGASTSRDLPEMSANSSATEMSSRISAGVVQVNPIPCISSESQIFQANLFRFSYKRGDTDISFSLPLL